MRKGMEKKWGPIPPARHGGAPSAWAFACLFFQEPLEGRPVLCVSRRLTKAEQGYSQTLVEALAIHWTTNRLQKYLHHVQFKTSKFSNLGSILLASPL